MAVKTVTSNTTAATAQIYSIHRVSGWIFVSTATEATYALDSRTSARVPENRVFARRNGTCVGKSDNNAPLRT